jgi:hypothetical protein
VLPFAMVRHGADDVPVLLGTTSDDHLAGLDLVEGRYFVFEPEDIGTVFDTDPAAVYFGIELAWAGAGVQRMAAEVDADKLSIIDGVQLVGPRGPHKIGMVVPPGGSNCAKCLFLRQGSKCALSMWVLAPKSKGGGGGDPNLPVSPDRWCCDGFQTAPTFRSEASEAARLPRQAALGRKFTPVLMTPSGGPLTGFSEVRSTLLRHRSEVPTLSTIVLTTVFAGLTVGTLIAVAERGFACITDLFKKARELPALDEVRGCIWPLGYHRYREQLYLGAPKWAPLVQQAIREGLKDAELRRHLFLRTETPYGISLAKLSFVLALLGHNVVCLDVRILDRMFGKGKAYEYSKTWGAPGSELSLKRYEQVEEAFLRGNPFYDSKDPVGKARAQWISWESQGRPARAEAHHSWLDVVQPRIRPQT